MLKQYAIGGAIAGFVLGGAPVVAAFFDSSSTAGVGIFEFALLGLIVGAHVLIGAVAAFAGGWLISRFKRNA